MRTKTNDFQRAQNDDFRMLVEARETLARSNRPVDVNAASDRIDDLCARMSSRIKHAAKLGFCIG